MDDESLKHPFCHPKTRRLHMVTLLMFAYLIMSWTTNNIGITMPCMVNSTAVALEVGIYNSANIVDYGGKYVWSTSRQNTIIAVAPFGGLITTIGALFLIDTKSVRHLLFIAMIFLSISSLALPFGAEEIGWIAVIALRVVMGAAEGLMLPGLNAMTTRWIPSHERSFSAAIYTSGNQFAGLFGSLIAAILCSSMAGWPAVFYVCGTLGILWSVAWLMTVRNSPEKSAWISDAEKNYLIKNIPPRMASHHKKIPLWDIFTSKPFLACIAGSIGTNVMLMFLLVYLPFYYKDVLQVEVKDNGFFSACPHAANLASKLAWGWLMDYFKKKKILTPTTACKISQLVAMTMIAFSFAALGYLVDKSTPYLAVVIVCCMGCGFGLCISGFLTSLLSLAPNYIGALSAFIQLVGFGARMLTPVFINYFKTTGTPAEWRNIMLVYVAITATTAVVFTFWGSGEIQPWNYNTNVLPAGTVATVSDDNKLPLIMENGETTEKINEENANVI